MKWGIRKVGTDHPRSYVGMAWAWFGVPHPPTSFDSREAAAEWAERLTPYTTEVGFEVFENPKEVRSDA